MSKELLQPTFFILGVQKGGTSTLHHYLSQNSELFFPKKKELHFFDAYYHKGEAWYLNHFMVEDPHSYRIAGEATPSYFFHPFIAKRVHKMFPKAKFIVLFRDPVDRAFSHYQMSVRRGLEKLSFEEAIAQEEVLMRKQRIKLLWNKKFNLQLTEKSYLSRGCYAKQVHNWFRYFDRNQFLFLQSETLFSNPKESVNSVCQFLGVAPISIIEEQSINVGSYSSKMTIDMRQRLAAYFQKENAELKALTGLDVSWNK